MLDQINYAISLNESCNRVKRVVETAISNVALNPAILPSVIVESGGLISNYDLGLANDKGHFFSQAQIEFGHRYFTSFKMLPWCPINNTQLPLVFFMFFTL